MTNQELAVSLLRMVGGTANIEQLTNCMTRLRIRVKDETVVNTEAIKQTAGVLGLVIDNGTYQIVLGPGKVKKVADICLAEIAGGGAAADKADGQQSVPSLKADCDGDWHANKERFSKLKNGRFQQGIRVIADIFIPLLPAIIAAGLFNGFASLIGALQGQGILAGDGFWQTARLFLSLMGMSFLGYFAIYTGINAAKQFGATEALGGMIGAVTIGGNIVELARQFQLYDEAVPLNSILTTGKGGIIGVIFGVWILAKLEKAIRRRMPDVLDLILTPFLAVMATSVILVFAVMPAAGILSDVLIYGLNFIINSSNPVISIISGYLMAALFLPMVLLGLHHGLIPIYAIQLEALGGVSLFPTLAMAGAGQVGASIAIYLLARKAGNRRLQSTIAGALPAGFLGVGEPLIYGVTLPLFKPFITAGLGAGFGGAYVMLSHVMSNAWGPSGITALPIMKPECMMNYLFGLLIAYAGGFIITSMVMRKRDVEDV